MTTKKKVFRFIGLTVTALSLGVGVLSFTNNNVIASSTPDSTIGQYVTRSVTRTYTSYPPSSINHSIRIGNDSYSGTLTRTSVAQQQGPGGQIRYTATYSGRLYYRGSV